jgi:hypothetical protein
MQRSHEDTNACKCVSCLLDSSGALKDILQLSNGCHRPKHSRVKSIHALGRHLGHLSIWSFKKRVGEAFQSSSAITASKIGTHCASPMWCGGHTANG